MAAVRPSRDADVKWIEWMGLAAVSFLLADRNAHRVPLYICKDGLLIW